jgi:ElaB/YqjD/DUF883 family membrane-anchored ribosome-binding protein
MDQRLHKEERIEDAVKGVLGNKLDAVEGTVDTVVDEAKTQLHELRKDAQQVSEQTLGRLERSWEDTLSRIEEYLVSRPWLVFGAFCAIAFLFSQRQRSNPNAAFKSAGRRSEPLRKVV